ncbi:hypothetical protein RvY_17352 [Ramazzottius varieornatus]|uniref:Uncharacterized protein n=1 Tax=Ramazzottius varieornatus TaxID=947166 RepID=A0A1D1W1U5_RAMVA|nr:hypothetical protein RvY_17352 [Ramazzottius varieornatus]
MQCFGYRVASEDAPWESLSHQQKKRDVSAGFYYWFLAYEVMTEALWRWERKPYAPWEFLRKDVRERGFTNCQELYDNRMVGYSADISTPIHFEDPNLFLGQLVSNWFYSADPHKEPLGIPSFPAVDALQGIVLRLTKGSNSASSEEGNQIIVDEFGLPDVPRQAPVAASLIGHAQTVVLTGDTRG